MMMRKKNRKRLIWFLVVVLAVIFWRGLKDTTKETHTCEYKIIYAVCTPKGKATGLPSIWSILKAGVRFR